MKLDSGLEFRDEIVGKGQTAKTGDLVRVHYTGWAVENETDLFQIGFRIEQKIH